MKVLRDADVLTSFPLTSPPDIGLPRGSDKTFELVGPDWLLRNNDETPNYPPGYVANPMPYPNYGFEFSHGLAEHLRLQLWIKGEDLWQWTTVYMAVKHIRLAETRFGFQIWKRDPFWTGVYNWAPKEVIISMSEDPSKGYPVYELDVPKASQQQSAA